METLTLQESALVEEVRRLTEQEGLDSEDFLAEAVRRHLATFRQKRLIAETEGWYRLSPVERQRYEGVYVAVYQGQVVDSDADRLALYYRVREKYGRQTILITPGGDQPLPFYRVRSPRQGTGGL